jgi:hypothetical protein
LTDIVILSKRLPVVHRVIANLMTFAQCSRDQCRASGVGQFFANDEEGGVETPVP